MAEIALAVPGLIDAIVGGGSLIMNILQDYSEADEIRAEYTIFAKGIAMDGMSFYFLETVKRAMKDPSLPGTAKEMFESCIRRFHDKLSISIIELRASKTSKLSGRVHYALRGKTTLTKCINSLKEEADMLHKMCLEFSLFSIGVHSSILSRENFALIHESEDNHPGQYVPTSDILVAKGEVNLGLGKSTEYFIVEGKVDGETNLRSLCELLRTKSSLNGIPECVGFRIPPYGRGLSTYELIFKAPPLESSSSLAHLISSSIPPNVQSRLELATELARAVVSVHKVGFVHKNIRPRSVLVIQGKPPSNNCIGVFLYKWTAARNMNSVSSHLGEDLWQQAIYQHPDRQSRYAMGGFEPCHDVYSLGVCLLEIFLWRPFTVASPPPKLALYGAAHPVDELDQELSFPAWIIDLFVKRLAQIGENVSLLRQQPCKLMEQYRISQQVWETLAATELAREQPKAAEIVTQCLQLQLPDASDVLAQLCNVKPV
ncbi:hypothetical protein BJX99DRAFT_265694 [Aspergillus californicus]